jgi:methylenetetrahydrofolate reductase (NADPH)
MKTWDCKLAMKNSFRDKLEHTSDFLLTFELVPGRSPRGRSVDRVLSLAQKAGSEALLDALSITDNPGGHPSLSPDVLGREIQQMGIDPIVHFACRDWNRYGAFSRALQLDRLSIENLLVVTGDYPTEGPEGTAKPCFDLDSVTMMCMLDGMNRGTETFCGKTKDVKSETTNFLLGAAVSCFKYAEGEVIYQYHKLLKKVHNGARFAITQICYDARKLHELQQFLHAARCTIPVLGSVYVLSKTAARALHEGRVPGASISQELLGRVLAEADSPDKGKSASLIRAARLIAILKGLGYRGAHIAGRVAYDDIRTIILHFREIQDQWRDFVPEFDFPYPGGFYIYDKNERTGLNADSESIRSRRSICAYLNQSVMKAFHHGFFDKNKLHYPCIRRCAAVIDNVRALRAGLFLVENVSKSLLFDCQKCGDCALEEMAYLCPESQCPKYLRNGPCGGSDKARCEVRKERLCVWVKVYDRLKTHNEESRLNSHCVPPRNWALNGTSSWLNFYGDRDYHASALPFCERNRNSP